MITASLGRVSPRHKGEYNSSNIYTKLDIVSYLGSSYMVLKDTVGVTPVVGPNYQLIAGAGTSTAITNLTVSTGAPGTAATVTPGGTALQRTYALTVPRGDKGVDGSFAQKAYTTEALMIADKAEIPTNTSVMVTNDTAPSKNGLYAYNGTTFTKSAYDPTALANTYTDNKVKGVTNNFKIKALMTASTLPNDSYAMVTDDTDNNGLYVKTAGAWVKSEYDFKSSMDNLSKKLGFLIDVDDYSVVPRYPSLSSGTWIKNNAFTGRFIPISTGGVYKITASDSSYGSVICPTDFGGIEATGILKNSAIRIDSGDTYTFENTEGFSYLWVSEKDDLKQQKPQKIEALNKTFLSSGDVANDIFTDNRNALVTVDKIAEISKDVDSVKDNLLGVIPNNSEFELLEGQHRLGFYRETNHLTGIDRGIGSNEDSYTILLNAGDVLEFYYRPTRGATFVERFTNTNNDYGYTILGQNFNDASKVRHFKFVATKTAYYTMHSVLLKSIVLNGSPVDKTLLKVVVNDPRLSWVYPAGFRETEEWLAYKSTTRMAVSKGDVIRIDNVVKNSAAILADINIENNSNLVVVRAVPPDYAKDYLEWTANESMEIVLQGYANSDFYIKKAVNVKSLIEQSKLPFDPSNIGVMTLPPLETVFATHLSFILKTEMIKGVENIAISQNLGKTWTYIPNIIGKIVNYHFFTDGTILLSSEKECYWTDDYVTINESVLLDEDGSPFVAAVDAHHFFGQQTGDKPMFVDGQEVYVWGEYAISGTTVGVWYTTDYGRTIKRAVDFQGENFGGITINIRHVHKVYYHAKQETFYVMTGDFGDENMLMSGIYNPSLDAWTWEVIGRGHEYKFGNMWCDDYYAYFTTDYTEAAFKEYWGIVRVGLNHLGDPSKFRLAWDAKEGGWGGGSPYRFIADRNGNKIVIGELYTSGYIMVATTGYNFKRVDIHPSVVLSFIIGPNDNGDIYMKADLFGRGLGTNAANHLSGGTVNITKMLRNAGLVNFMTGEQNIPHLPYTSE